MTWHTAITPRVVLGQLLMRGTSEVSTAFWSLRYEMILSIVFPALCWLLVRLRATGSFLLGILLCLFGIAIDKALPTWASCFIIGAALAGAQGWISRIYPRLPQVAKWSLLLGSCLLYLYSESRLLPLQCSIAVCVLLTFAQHSRASLWLDSPVPEYLGRISYSLYLVHGTVLFTTIIALYGKVPPWLIVVVGLIMSLAVAHLFCILVEEPFTRLGRRIRQV
jgi:peptidoglycan/LPS O-acetylase OafA/YrhL